MLYFMRKHAKFFYVFFFLIIISFIFFYVGPIDDNAMPPLAEIEEERILVEEFWRAYDTMRDFYREIYKENFDAEMEQELNLKQTVLNELVSSKILYVAAKEIGMVITDDELRDTIMNDPAFQRDGQFRQDVYLRTLQLNRITPQYFEEKKREELLVKKIRELIEASVLVSVDDIPEMQGNEELVRSLREMILNEKKAKAVEAYVEGLMKEKYQVIIRAELIA